MFQAQTSNNLFQHGMPENVVYSHEISIKMPCDFRKIMIFDDVHHVNLFLDAKSV
jgi:hypothetical protein